nr:mitochondrial ribonuclease P protein 1 homolog [Cherax quadricarinatus]
MTARVGATLCVSSRCHLYLRRWAAPSRSLHLRFSSELAKSCGSRVTNCQHPKWVKMKMDHQLQLGKVKLYCTSNQQHTRGEKIDGDFKNTEDDHKPVSDSVILTEEYKISHDIVDNTRTKRVNFELNNASIRADSVAEAETNIITNDGVKVSGGTPSVVTEEDEEVDMEELIKLEVELLRQEGFSVPSTFTPNKWQELLTKGSFHGRKKFLRYLFITEMKKLNEKKKREIKRKIREETSIQKEREKAADNEHIQYGLFRNSIFLKVLDSTTNQFFNSRVISAMMFGQPLVLDMDFENHMTTKERQNCAFQIQMLIGGNRVHADPYAIHLCNVDSSADTMQRLAKFIPTMYQPEFPLIMTPESYLDTFPRDKLVYLTPHCNENMENYDHDAIYIVGALVDKSNGAPLTLAKAKKEGIKMKKLPLDRYLPWGIGGKSLTINQVVNIMLDMKHTDDWQYSLRHVPRRKLQSTNSEVELEDVIRKRISKQKRVRHYSYSLEPTHRRYKMD